MPTNTKFPAGAKNPLVLMPRVKAYSGPNLKEWSMGHEELVQTQTLMQQQNVTQPISGFDYPHSQPWRAGQSQSGGPQGSGMNLGPMGKMLPQVVISIELNSFVFTQVEQAAKVTFNNRITENGILTMIRNTIYDPLKQVMFNDIANWVPKDSGRLRNAMELSIAGGGVPGGNASSTSQINGLHPFYVVLSTGDVPYASVVENMPDPWVQHDGPTHQGGLSSRYGRTVSRKKGPHELHDPQARQGAFGMVLANGRQMASNLWNQFENTVLPTLLNPILIHPSSPLRMPLNILISRLFTVVIP